MSNSNQMPKEEGLDHSLSFVREGYQYILNRRRSFHSEIFETRLLGQKAICMGGKEAAELFYDTDKFKRAGAAPNRIMETLFGKGGVQGLDGQPHRHRKELFMSVMTRDDLKRLRDITAKQWELAIRKWEQTREIILYDEVKELLTRTACEWVGLPLEEGKVKAMTANLAAMFESPAAFGPAHWKGRHARNKVEHQMEELINKIRAQGINIPEHSILYKFTWHRDLDGELLDPGIVAVEIINLLRPIVAIAVFINFTFLATYHYPHEKEKLRGGDDTLAQMFIQEVRRFYPFFPSTVALVKKDFTWKGYHFEEGTLTLLDLYGTNHDSNIWDNPDVFKPERFTNWGGSPFEFIPQGGGDYFLGHRCAGEWATVDIMKVSLVYIVNGMSYEVPEQDLSFSMTSSIPSIPKSKIVLTKVQLNER